MTVRQGICLYITSLLNVLSISFSDGPAMPWALTAMFVNDKSIGRIDPFVHSINELMKVEQLGKRKISTFTFHKYSATKDEGFQSTVCWILIARHLVQLHAPQP
jgi:hypothetical protein